MLVAGHRALKKVIPTIRAGITAKSIFDTLLAELEPHGLAKNFTPYSKGLRGVGHAVGTDVVEPPNMSLDSDFELDAGMTMAIKLDLHDLPGGGYRVEVVVAVTEDGVRPLNKPVLNEPDDFAVQRQAARKPSSKSMKGRKALARRKAQPEGHDFRNGRKIMSIRRTVLSTIGAAAAMLLGGIAHPTLAADTTIRVASVTGPTYHHNIALRWFADRVAARDAGMNIQVLDGAQPGGERGYIEGTMLGSIQMAQVSTEPVAGFIPEYDLFSLPYLIRDTDHFKAVVSGPVGAKYGELAEARVLKILAWFDNGYRDVFNKVRPVVTPDDLSGLKIRVMESPPMVSTVNAVAGSATLMSCSELSTALEQGVLDGGENAAGNVLNDKFHEVTGYFSLRQHFRPPGIVAIKPGHLDRADRGTAGRPDRRGRGAAALRNPACRRSRCGRA